MGVQLGDLISKKVISFDLLRGKIIALDAYNCLYQFLSIIRQPDGTPLKTSNGKITSHISGLLYRTINLIELGVKPTYVFDGEPHELKSSTIEGRQIIRRRAREEWIKAIEIGAPAEEIRRVAQASSRLSEEMIEESKQLLEIMGVPWVQSPSEGEAQAAYMANKGTVHAAGSQDWDSILYGAPRLVRNLTITGKRKLPRKNVWVEVELELIELEKVLQELNLTREQLVDLAILIGTDYNPDGLKKVGPKRALELVRKFGSIEKMLNDPEWESRIKEEILADPLEIREIFLKPKVTDKYKLQWKEPQAEKVIDFLYSKREFSEERIKKALERLQKAMVERKQATLERFF
ncbi:MAG: flap endonuclease-1 [Euryarchaeota archaeon]|nr:flap endonuclease-1 [Euryarchaeota archaeon]